MSKIKQQLSHLLPQIITPLDNITVDDKHKIQIKCQCGKTVEVGARSLARRWTTPPYRCKSCDIKTYASNPEKIEKFKKSFGKTASNPAHRAKCSISGKLAMASVEARLRASTQLTERNKTDPRIIEGRKKALKIFMETIGREHLLKIRINQTGKESILEKTIKSILNMLEIEYIQQYTLGYYKYDFYISKFNLLIEIQGEYWHRNTVAKDSAKATYAHKLGYIVKHIWEHEFTQMGKVETLIKEWTNKLKLPQIDFDLNSCIIKELDTQTARIFYGTYHYLPAISKSGYHIGCYLNGELIACSTWSKPSRQEIAIKQELNYSSLIELSRFCIASKYHKYNFASWFLTRSTKLFHKTHPNIIRAIAFADTSIHLGTIYKACNWEYNGNTKSNYMYRSPDGYLTHKKSIWDHATKLSISEADYANLNGYMKVWSAPKSRFIWSF